MAEPDPDPAPDVAQRDGADHDGAGHGVRADLLTGAALTLLGGLVVSWSWTMPRLENRGVMPLTVPGLVPGALGAVLAGLGALLLLRSLPVLRDGAAWRHFAATLVGAEARRAAMVIALALLYPLGLLGLVPFWVATALFVLAFVLVFELWLTDAPRPVVRSLVTGAVQAVIVGVVVAAIFERGFLVRLP